MKTIEKLLVVALFAIIAAAPAVRAQDPAPAPAPAGSTPFTVQLGVDTYDAVRVPNGSLSVLFGDKTRGGVTIDLKSTGVFGHYAYATRAAFEQTIFSNEQFEIHAIGQGGVAKSSAPDSLSGIFSGGAGVVIVTGKLRGWEPFVNFEAEVVPASANASPTLSINAGVRKKFGGS